MDTTSDKSITWGHDYNYVPEEVIARSEGLREPLDKSFRMWKIIYQTLARLMALETNWDGEGADAPNPLIVVSVNHLLAYLQKTAWNNPPSRVVPTSDGGVLIEWQSTGFYREVEVLEPFVGEVMTVVGGHTSSHDKWRWDPHPQADDEWRRGELVPVGTAESTNLTAWDYAAAA